MMKISMSAVIVIVVGAIIFGCLMALRQLIPSQVARALVAALAGVVIAIVVIILRKRM